MEIDDNIKNVVDDLQENIASNLSNSFGFLCYISPTEKLSTEMMIKTFSIKEVRDALRSDYGE